MSEHAQQLAQSLLDAQVQFWLQELTTDKLQSLLEQELPYLYEKIGALTLREAISEDKVKATARRYAVEMEIEGGIPELFGEIANIIYEHPNNELTSVQEVLPDDIVNDFLEKIFERGSLLDEAVNNIRGSAPFREFLADVVFTVAKGYALEQNQLVKLAPVASGVQRLRAWLNDQAPGLAENMHSMGKQLSRASVDQSIRLVDDILDNDLYRDTALNSVLDLWDDIKTWKVSGFQRYFTEMDLQELMVLGYEFWLQFRHTDYLKSCIDAGVKFVFTKYGDETVDYMLQDLGVTQDMVVSEILNYAPDLAQLLLQHDIAEPLIRRHLQRFYFADTTLQLLGERPAG
ncbi:MAG: hypothetical protein CMK83_25340 [Pseudomonadales bacterium]|jgi:hypothetical protein|uniref:hypothetical protein n=1 Tax=unclassified Ketobacter TaxID=2639109 RepID=UPI000C438A23|nr:MULTISPECIES: hypothetical protein [unclassified Ketobacter]MAA58897.1 hypothetical protein [Pseudomonadales bacterium]MEC8813210.1 hypothetical protein [Pseudomonadota bacterium]TNC88366.1 MAG: hypothetical protein CSH49_11925 [Alcanivorax sp.]HAG92899.1 hypothetical protein [Gammaproteobacteria bacterium]MAQ23008.1 hypothetical protein [Pseudomonadales bacterium]|tara:strand:- start:11585 stop:12622 length:1038 start_codon:yes stop_codon:yes gene_type:complete